MNRIYLTCDKKYTLHLVCTSIRGYCRVGKNVFDLMKKKNIEKDMFEWEFLGNKGIQDFGVIVAFLDGKNLSILDHQIWASFVPGAYFSQPFSSRLRWPVSAGRTRSLIV
jgi:hypothetical protein